ncbi:MAG: hypothetical protein L6R40_002296 [Gallowayella cf. fulva]|nr:MAG: hypothetical protein L6R40_002296 [Xanthomendoza cf. fulva]
MLASIGYEKDELKHVIAASAEGFQPEYSATIVIPDSFDPVSHNAISSGLPLFSHHSGKADILFRGNQKQAREVAEASTGHDPFAEPAENDSNRSLRNSTMTASEKAVFERIFKQISDDASKEAAKEENPFESEFDDDEPSQGDAYSDLSAIFDLAIQRSEMMKKDSSKSDAGRKHPDYRTRHFMTAVEAVAGTGNGSIWKPIRRSDDDYKKIETAIVENNRMVLNKIYEARTDTEIWHVMETEVFSLIAQYENHQSKKSEEQDRGRSREGKPKQRTGGPQKADKEAAAAAEKHPSLQARKLNLHEAEIQGILSSNYGDYCLAAMRKLRRLYPTSPYPMNILPKVKSLGSISHVLASSVDLYNEVLFLLWSEYSDLHAMADLIIEMGNQGIESNTTTLEILKMVLRAKKQALRGKRDNPTRLWWSLFPVETGWKRVVEVANKVRHDFVQAKARRAMMEERRQWRTRDEKAFRVKRNQGRGDIAFEPSVQL